jgi:hypothetical protein
MPAANQSDFFGEGTAAAAFAPQETPAQRAERQRLEDIRAAEERRRKAESTASNNVGYKQTRGEEDAWNQANPELSAYESEAEKKRRLEEAKKTGVWDDIKKIWTSDPVTTSVLAAPYAIGAAGALIPAATGAAAPAFSAVGPSAGGVATAGGAAAPTVLTAGGASGLAGAAAPAAASWLTPGNAMAAGGLLLQGGALVANQIRTRAEKDLIKKQEEIAAAADARRAQVQQEGMNRLGQQMLAMNPMNQTMAEMFGPSAAYTPDQMAGMAADPGANPAAAGQAFDNNNPNPQFSMEDIARANADKRRQDMVRANTSPLGPGPAPLQQRTPQAARRF